ncbi:hypothetical protein D9M71_535500 [compost metagenome]
MLVVMHQHLLDACAELAGDTGDFALHVGVVGGLDEAADEIPAAEQGGGYQAQQHEEDGKATLELCGHGKTSVWLSKFLPIYQCSSVAPSRYTSETLLHTGNNDGAG